MANWICVANERVGRVTHDAFARVLGVCLALVVKSNKCYLVQCSLRTLKCADLGCELGLLAC